MKYRDENEKQERKARDNRKKGKKRIDRQT